ncbi:outer membrane protein OmpA-like peptidoglycan-associated protein [Amycolatopsis lexingtonensis]|uniref:Outer membrane protein OmpA-like peptidoglycan-associated protein n=1 Tax=Amycolatopsis lexingtonensis TaxID=218822 RepID=A0ABR9IBB3_9PSEU|nr:OmpA family protein [Amycolatopsis lexingtonensis]MBE1500470.1 outer membrane protein OmpA-like peptidoglycan-associated protein [Amycolatopsis lexingtonensis]
MSGRRRWILLVPIAVLVTALLAGVVTWAQAGSVQRDLTARAQAALAAAGLPAGNVSFDGRDATLNGFPPGQALRALEVVQGVDGVRTAEFEGDVVPVAPSTTEAPPPSSSTSTSPPPPTTTTTAPPPTDKAGVQAEIDRLLAEAPVTFVPDTARLTPEGEQAARGIAVALAKAPETFRYRVTGHVGRGPGGESAALKLSRDRARAVARILTTNGLTTKRVTYRGLGDTRPASGGEEDRRVEITVI